MLHNVSYIIDISKYSPEAQAKFIELNNRMQKEFEEEMRLKDLSVIDDKKMINSIDLLPDILTPQEVAAHLGISRRRVYEYCQLSESHGGLKSWQIGKSRKIDKTDFINWMKAQKGEI